MPEQAAEMITSRRGGKKLLHKGFIYYRLGSRKGNTYWSCNKKKECNATAVTCFTNGAVEILKEKDHVHAPNREEVEAERVVSRLKRIAGDHPELPPAQILRTELPKCWEGVISQLPQRENLKYQSTLAGEQFIIYDSYEEGEADEEDR
ncbi:FLYWCH-type zinc finger-containing protein 1, partial [Frankliniella fusca]